MTKIKIVFSLLSLTLLAASCSLFSKPASAGIVKTTNGGSDWQFTNAVEQDGKPAGNISEATIGPIVVYPNDTAHVYAASYNRGLLKSTNGGQTWQQILSKIAVHDVALDPNDEQKIYASGIVGGIGRLLLTTDGGKSWQDMFTESTPDNPVKDIALNPSNSSELVLGTQRGSVVKSTDGGVNWSLLQNFDDRLQSVVWQDSGQLLVLLKNKGLMVSRDQGLTFQDTTTSISNRNSGLKSDERPETFFQLAASLSNPSEFVITADTGPFKTTDGGTTWTRLKIPTRAETVNTRPVAIAPSSDSVIYTAVGATLYKSTDGGSTFQTQAIATTGFINYIVVDPNLPQVAYAGIVTQ